jgi:hypothetical protein
MQSLHTGHVRDLSNFLEGGGSPTKSPEKPSAPSTPQSRDLTLTARSPEKDKDKDKEKEKENTRSTTPTPGSPSKDIPSLRPSLRRPPQSILGENAPPQSATMLALQSMSSSRDNDSSPLSNVTNGSTALVRTPQTFDAISTQILSLTSICTSLQREMAQLSRRSKDNATDLVSLKEATNARDEDIRKSLRDLVSNLSKSGSQANALGSSERYLLENTQTSTPRSIKTISLPRIPSPSSFSASLDRGLAGSPLPYNPEGAATIALLEKVLRDMGTREGQEELVSRLTEVAERLAKDNSEAAKKMNDILNFVKQNTGGNALVMNGGGGGDGTVRPRNFSFDDPPRFELDFNKHRSGPMVSRVENLLGSSANKETSHARGSDSVNEDILKLIKTVKDSVAQGGGLTAEVKALVRELRGEVLGMGRDLGRKLEDAAVKSGDPKTALPNKDQIAHIIQESLDELKEHMDHVMREARRQSGASTVSRCNVDAQEVYSAVQSAVAEMQRYQDQRMSREPKLGKEEIINAVRHAWENYKPDIDVQHFGLERDELLSCLKDGIQESLPREEDREVGATREEVFMAVVEGLKHFSPPQLATEASLTRDEILESVRECLEEFEFPAAPAPEPRETDLTREDMVEAVRQGLSSFEFPNYASAVSRDVGDPLTRDDLYAAVRSGIEESQLPQSNRDIGDSLTRDDVYAAVKAGIQETQASVVSHDSLSSLTKDDVYEAVKAGIEESHTSSVSQEVVDSLTRDDIYDAIRAGLQEGPAPTDSYAAQVLDRLHEVLEAMKAEFRAVSDEAKQNMAAHGRDTEQVLDATKDGLEKLRVDIETYVDRAADVTGKDEILDAMREYFDGLRTELSVSMYKGSAESLASFKDELDNFRETMATSMVPAGRGIDKDEIMSTLRDGLDEIRTNIDRPRDSNESVLSGTGEILDAIHDGLGDLKVEVEKIGSKPVDQTVNYEILDTLRAGLEGLRVDMDRLRESGLSDRDVAAPTSGAVITTPSLQRNDIENLEVLITQLRIKVEAMESMPPSVPVPPPSSVSREDLAHMEETLRNVQESVVEMSGREQSRSLDEETIKKDDFDAIETLLRNTKAKIDDMDPENLVKKENLDIVEELVRETRDGVIDVMASLGETAKRDDVIIVEALVKDILTGLSDLKEQAESDRNGSTKATKTDVEAVESLVFDMKAQLELMVTGNFATMATKDDVNTLGDLVKDVKGKLDAQSESNSTALEDRQAEIVGVSERVTEVKILLEEFKDSIKEKLNEGAAGMEAVEKLLVGLGDTVNQNSNVGEDVREVLETVKTEFDRSNAGVVGVKLESDEKFAKTWDKLDEKFDELMLKYDDAQHAAEAKEKAGEERAAETEATMLNTKAIAEDLRLLIDTLGSTLTDSVDKMDESSKTVFNRVEDTFTRVEETHADTKAEHQLTRDQITKALCAVEDVQSNVSEFQPKLLDSIKDVLSIVGQHYEHSKSSTDTIQEKIAQRRESNVSEEAVKALLLREAPAEKYDDTQVHQKLDKLVDDMQSAGKSFAQLEMLDKIHQQVMQTATEVSAFVTEQKQQIVKDHEDKEKAADAAFMALHKHLAEKELVEAQVSDLRQEQDHLKDSVSALKVEQDQLALQKMRLAADVASLETALRIRREELNAMEDRAEGLERRILEGIMDQSRVLLMSSKMGSSQNPMRRAPSQATSTAGSAVSNATSRTNTSHIAQNAVGMALNGNRGVTGNPFNNRPAAGASRRILSLNQMTSNLVPQSNFKRSHSVKDSHGSGALRKTSWGGNLNGHGYGDLNKENLALKESDEDSEVGDDVSDSGTLRRTSMGTIMTGTGTDLSGSIDEGSEYSETESGYDDESEVTEGDGNHVVLYEDPGLVA